MVTIDDILRITTERDFEDAAMEIFRFQASHCAPYAEYLSLIDFDPHSAACTGDIPHLPIEIFKSHDVYCGERPAETVFTSSTTGGGQPSRHAMAHREDYEKTFLAAFERFYGSARQTAVFALLPGYLEREGSSLVYMADRLIKEGGGGFFLNDYDGLLRAMEAHKGRKILLGVSYALWDLAEKYAPKLGDTIVMETGGMKGNREELPRNEFHALLCRAFAIEHIHSEYGMAELTSQAYSPGGGIFEAPPWMRISVRDLNDPFDIRAAGSAGGVNITDLANISSCAFIQTADLGRMDERGRFEILGRIDRSEIRGCNLLVQ